MLPVLLKHLETIEATNVRFRRHTDIILDDVTHMLRGLCVLDQEDRAVFDKHVTKAVGRKLIAISARYAERAIDTRDVFLLDLALLAHVAEGFRADYRENNSFLVIVDHAAHVLGISLEEVYAPLRPFADDRSNAAMNQFFRRDPGLNKLSVFGLVAKNTPEGVHISAS